MGNEPSWPTVTPRQLRRLVAVCLRAAGAVDHYCEPSDEWLAEHSLGIDGTITDEHVFKAMLNELVRDTTKGYSLGGSFRSRTFKRRSRRCPEGFGILGIRRSGGAAASRLDLVFLVDATSSMSPYIKNVANSLYWMTKQLSHFGVIDWRIGVAWYRDHQHDHRCFGQHRFTRDPAEVHKRLDGLRACGGGPEPESVAFGLYSAVRRQLGTNGLHGSRDHHGGTPGSNGLGRGIRVHDAWRPDAKRVAFIITDASCYLQDGDITLNHAIHVARAAGVKVYVLGPWQWQPYQRIAELTGGKLFRVDNLLGR